MANITGKDGRVRKQVAGVDTLIAGVKSWTIDIGIDLVDVTAFGETAVSAKTYMSALQDTTGSFDANHTDATEPLTIGSEYNMLFETESDGIAYYGTAKITGKGASAEVAGEITQNYSFQFTGKIYVLGATVVVDGDFTGDGSDWDTSDAGVSYDTTNDQLDWTGDSAVFPTVNNVITSSEKYWSQIKIENETGTSVCALTIGGKTQTSRTSNGTYTEVMTEDTSAVTFGVSVTTDGTLSTSEIIIRKILN